MTVRRVLTVLVLVAGLALTSSRATGTTASSPSVGPCTASALSASLSHVVSVARFECSSTWAYLWANVDSPGGEVSVTELLSFATGEWRAVARAAHCQAGDLPELVYRGACFSN